MTNFLQFKNDKEKRAVIAALRFIDSNPDWVFNGQPSIIVPDENKDESIFISPPHLIGNKVTTTNGLTKHGFRMKLTKLGQRLIEENK
jgi:hypothetical protein